MPNILQSILFQYASYFGANAHILVKPLQRRQILLRASSTYFGQLRIDLIDAFAIQLFAKDGELAFEMGCKQTYLEAVS